MKNEHREFKYFGLSLLQLMGTIAVIGIILTVLARYFFG